MPTLGDLIPLRTADCHSSSAAVSAIAARERGGSPAARDHVMHCLRCQAEVAAYRRVLRVMSTMREDPVALSVVGSSASLSDFSRSLAVPVSPWAVRAAYVGGITAGAAGMLVWLSRRRPLVHAG